MKTSLRSALLICTETAHNIPEEHQTILSSPCLPAKSFEIKSGGNDKYRSGNEIEDG